MTIVLIHPPPSFFAPYPAARSAAQNLADRYYVTYDSDTVQVTSNDRFYSGRGRTFTLSWRGAF